MKNETLQDIINDMAPDLRESILNSRDIKHLNSLKKEHRDDPDVIAVINARIENLTYLAV